MSALTRRQLRDLPLERWLLVALLGTDEQFAAVLAEAEAIEQEVSA